MKLPKTASPEIATLSLPPAASLAVLAPDLELAREFVEASQSKNTRRAYATQWRGFLAWAKECELEALPATPATVALYIAHLAGAGRRPATIDLAIAAIVDAHYRAGHSLDRRAPAIREVRRGLRRTLGTAQREAAPLLVDGLRAMLAPMGDRLIDRRDRALLLIGFAGGFRRSELVGLDVADVATTKDGLDVRLRWSKTDQEGAGRVVAIPRGSAVDTCPVEAFEAWREERVDEEGPLFVGVTRWNRLTGHRLTGDDVSRILRKRALAAALSVERLSGHSLRAGLVTEAARAGRSIASIQRTTGHKSADMVQKYIRQVERWIDNAAKGLL
jgi:integrase